jgi:uncharacterized membrane protein YbhN (UPF0104 family)
VQFGAAVVISAVLVAWLLRDLGLGAVVDVLRGVWVPGLLMGVVAFAIMTVGRVARYWVLLETPPPVGPLTLVVVVRNMTGDLLPTRLGTLVYVWLVNTRLGVPVAHAFASFFLALVLDMVAIAPLLLGALLVVGFGWESTGLLAMLSLGLLLVSVIALVLLAPGLRLAGRLLQAAVPSATRLPGLALETADQVDAVRARRALWPAVALSFVVRVAKFGGHYLILQSVLLPLDVAWGSLGFIESFLGVAGAELSSMLPIAGLGAFGTWEAAFALGFSQLGLTFDQAVLAGFSTHILSQLHDYGLGVVALILVWWPKRR